MTTPKMYCFVFTSVLHLYLVAVLAYGLNLEDGFFDMRLQVRVSLLSTESCPPQDGNSVCDGCRYYKSKYRSNAEV